MAIPLFLERAFYRPHFDFYNYFIRFSALCRIDRDSHIDWRLPEFNERGIDRTGVINPETILECDDLRKHKLVAIRPLTAPTYVWFVKTAYYIMSFR